MMKKLIRLTAAVLGLCGLGIIVFEVLPKWQIISSEVGLSWILAPILTLFAGKEATNATRLVEGLHISPKTAAILRAVITLCLIVLSVCPLVSIPLLWYGTIEELARSAGG
jgi:hypothetical protein